MEPIFKKLVNVLFDIAEAIPVWKENNSSSNEGNYGDSDIIGKQFFGDYWDKIDGFLLYSDGGYSNKNFYINKENLTLEYLRNLDFEWAETDNWGNPLPSTSKGVIGEIFYKEEYADELNSIIRTGIFPISFNYNVEIDSFVNHIRVESNLGLDFTFENYEMGKNFTSDLFDISLIPDNVVGVNTVSGGGLAL